MTLVLLPYEITLFSNAACQIWKELKVLLPYEITLFSNSLEVLTIGIKVLLPYEITLFSNVACQIWKELKFYYLMKLHYSQTSLR